MQQDQDILYETGKKCNRRIGVRLARNVYTPSMAGAAEDAKVHGKPKRCTTGDDGQRKGSGSGARKEIRMTIERCEKCGKSFMRKSEVEHHKMWEHHPVSPLDERLAAAADNNNSEDLHRLTSDVMAADCITSSSNGDDDNTAVIADGQKTKLPFEPFRL
jgi:hypothetical protein